MAKAFAESPSVRIRVHKCDFAEPAQFASSNFGIPRIFVFFLPSLFLRSLFSLKADRFIAVSIKPIFAILSINLVSSSHLEPNFDIGVVKNSLT